MKENKLKKEESIEVLNTRLLNLFREQFNLRMQISSNQLKQTHLLNLVRRNIARVKTVLTLKTRNTT